MCRSKAVSVEWLSSRPHVVRLVVAKDGLSAALAARKPGDSEVAAELQFELAARLRDEIQELKKELRQMMEATK